MTQVDSTKPPPTDCGWGRRGGCRERGCVEGGFGGADTGAAYEEVQQGQGGAVQLVGQPCGGGHHQNQGGGLSVGLLLKLQHLQGGVMNGRSMQDINARKMRETSLRREVNRSRTSVCGIFSLIVRWSSCSLRCSSWKQTNQAAGSLCLLHTSCSTFSKLLFVRIKMSDNINV